MRNFQKSPRGFTLIELMIAMVAGLIVSYAVVAFTMASMKSNAEYVQSAKLTQTLRNSLDLVVRELRRAGYDDAALTRLNGGADSPAVGNSNFTKICLGDSGDSDCNSVSEYEGDCIIYAYDRPGGTAGTVEASNGEVRGLRRVQVTPTGASSSVGVIEYAVSAGSTKPACDGAKAVYTSYPPQCNTTSKWCPLTDSATINIRGFDISDRALAQTGTASTTVGSNPNGVWVRNLNIAITGRLVGDNSITYLNGVSTSYKRGVTATVRVRSDCVRSNLANCNTSP